ncbi:MAG: alpha/beta hydrolase, partial [Candidatus Lokiarchaeota archaeon]|nr:alpha/beta hydrolase [Candidatus Lokiarchaeota archaeon]
IIFSSGFANIFNLMTQLFRVKSTLITQSSLNRYSNDFRVRKFTKPVLIIHGSSDMIIPHSEAILLYKSVPENVEKKLVTIEGAGHNDMINYRDIYFSALEDFVNKYK